MLYGQVLNCLFLSESSKMWIKLGEKVLQNAQKTAFSLSNSPFITYFAGIQLVI